MPTGLKGVADDGEHVGIHDRLRRKVELDSVALRRQPCRLSHDPSVDLGDQAELLGGREEAVGRDDLPLGGHHPDEQLVLDDGIHLEVDDRLCIEDEAVLIEGIPDAPHPAQLLELALEPQLLGQPFADVVEDEDRAAEVLGA